MINKLYKYIILVFKWFSFATGGIVVLALIAYVTGIIGPIEFGKNAYKSQTKITLSDEPQSIAGESQGIACIDTREPELINNLKNCWYLHNRQDVLELLHQSFLLHQDGKLTTWLREQIENKTYLSFDEEVHLAALNQIVPIEIRMNDLSKSSADREYLLNVIRSNSVNTSQALIVLGYYKEDADIPIFIDGAKSYREENVLPSIYALMESCSPKSRQALKEVMSLTAVRAYVEKNHLEDKLTKDIASRYLLCNGDQSNKENNY